jgi:hypothetical protein
MSGIISRALRCAQHRQDAARRAPDMAVTSDPRRGVAQVGPGGGVPALAGPLCGCS